jgi:hypothetical protein
MAVDSSTPNRYIAKIDECLLMAKTATTNKARAQFYATANYYLQLAEAESGKRASRFDSQST